MNNTSPGSVSVGRGLGGKPASQIALGEKEDDPETKRQGKSRMHSRNRLIPVLRRQSSNGSLRDGFADSGHTPAY